MQIIVESEDLDKLKNEADTMRRFAEHFESEFARVCQEKQMLQNQIEFLKKRIGEGDSI
jgi:predicted  nucleic acid-binding Zn-ribbon protein